MNPLPDVRHASLIAKLEDIALYPPDDVQTTVIAIATLLLSRELRAIREALHDIHEAVTDKEDEDEVPWD